MKPSPLEAQVDAQIGWIEAENDAIERDIAALGALNGEARSHASATIKRRLPALRAAVARCEAMMKELERDQTD